MRIFNVSDDEEVEEKKCRLICLCVHDDNFGFVWPGHRQFNHI